MTHARRGLTILAASLVAPLGLVSFLAVSDGKRALASAVIVLGVGPFVVLLLRARRGRNADLALTLAVANVCVLTPELALRAVDFHHESGIQFSYPRHFFSLVPDPELFWRLPRQPGVNALGFLGPEIETPKPRGVFRILVLGDSVPMQGYPEAAARTLSAKGRRVACASLAMAGYTSHQGRILAERYGAALEPDLVLVAYGWNDHWRAWGAVDSRKTVPGRGAAVFQTALRHVRLLQGVAALAEMIRPPEPLDDPRVPLLEYRANLARIARIFAARRVPVVFATAPSAHVRRGVPAYLVAERFVKRPEDAVEEHALYVAATRETAASENARLLDLAAEIEPRSDLDAIFLADGIHLTDVGSEVAGEILARVLESIIPPVSSGPR